MIEGVYYIPNNRLRADYTLSYIPLSSGIVVVPNTLFGKHLYKVLFRLPQDVMTIQHMVISLHEPTEYPLAGGYEIVYQSNMLPQDQSFKTRLALPYLETDILLREVVTNGMRLTSMYPMMYYLFERMVHAKDTDYVNYFGFGDKIDIVVDELNTIVFDEPANRKIDRIHIRKNVINDCAITAYAGNTMVNRFYMNLNMIYLLNNILQG